MGVSSQPNSSRVTQIGQTDFWQPFLFETVSKTVLKLCDRTLTNLLAQPLEEPDTAPMHHLIELIRRLRSSQSDEEGGQILTSDSLLPYVTDEAYDVLESFQAVPLQMQSGEKGLPPMLIEAMIPKLLWCIAGSAYPTMQMIEGVRVQTRKSETEGWLAGILRLVILLEMQTAEVEWSIDLATGCLPHQLLDRSWVIQAEEDGVVWNVTELGSIVRSSESANWADQQLQQITQALIAKTPTFSPLLEGIQVEFMAPRSGWQLGQMRLKLDYEFIPQSTSSVMATGQIVSNPVEAELLDEVEVERSPNSIRAQPHIPQSSVAQAVRTPVSVVEMPPQPLVATTIVRLADQSMIETFAKLATQQELVNSINWLRSLHCSNQSEDLVSRIVQEAYRISDLTYRTASMNFTLLQPELLIDELIPKLLWHVTRSSYEATQWISGVRTALLQQNANWENGTLRLVVILGLETGNERWFVDLATGRFVAGESWYLPPTAIAQIQANLLAEELIQLDTLQAQLMRTLCSTAPEVSLLMEGVAVEWLTVEHDWQPGNLQVTVGLDFTPDLF